MSVLVISSLDEASLSRLADRARAQGSTIEDEARRILLEAVKPGGPSRWSAVDAIRNRLAATGKTFSDSVELLREDRER